MGRFYNPTFNCFQNYTISILSLSLLIFENSSNISYSTEFYSNIIIIAFSLHCL